MHLLCDENIAGLDALPPDISVTRMPGRDICAEDLRDVDVLWVRSVTRVDRALLEGSRVRRVGSATAGVEHIDLDYLAASGIAFYAAPGANANAVVEYVLAALAALRDPWEALESGATLGVVGCGHVGRQLLEVAASLGWTTQVYDPWLHGGQVSDARLEEQREALAGILRCDVISLHCELHDRQPWPSRHLFDTTRLGLLTQGQWLINASRGAVVDNAALRARLGQPGAPQVVLDVWEGEPLLDPALLEAPKLRLATPHIAGYSWGAKWAATKMLARDTLGLGPEQLAEPDYGEAPLVWPEAADTSGFADGLLGQRYDIGADDRRLRAACGEASDSEVQRSAAFDRLRREYPLRRELRGSQIAAPQVAGSRCSDAERILKALGVLERETGFEPATSTLARLRSTN